LCRRASALSAIQTPGLGFLDASAGLRTLQCNFEVVPENFTPRKF
jgi:hypothetical protein